MAEAGHENSQVLSYLQSSRKLSQRLDALDRMLAHEGADGERWRKAIIEKTRDNTLEALADAAVTTASLGSIEGDVLTCLYVFGFTGKQTAQILGYSEERVWDLARRGRKRLRGLIPADR